MVWANKYGGTPATATSTPAPVTTPPVVSATPIAPVTTPPIVAAASPLPAVPVATPPTTPAPAPRTRARRAPAEAAPAPVTEAAPLTTASPAIGATTIVHTPTVYTAPAAVPAAAPVAGMLSLFAPRTGLLAQAQAAFKAATVSLGQPNIFATVELTGGQSGGLLDKCDMNVEGTDDALPQGRDPFHGVLLGWRHKVVLWPGVYNEDEKSRPIWSGIIGADQVDAYMRFQKAFSRCGYCPKDKRDVFIDHGQVTGHLELLLWEEEAGPMVARTCRTIGSFTKTLETVFGVFPNGEVAPTPVSLTPTTTEQSTKGRAKPFPDHHFHVAPSLNAQTQKAYADFQAFGQQIQTNPEMAAAFGKDWNEWNKTTVTEEQLALLDQIAALRY